MSIWEAEPNESPEEPGDELALPDHLEVPMEASEADVVDQNIEVPTDDEQ